VSQAILSAAEAVIGEQGANAHMEAIASKAGVAVGTLYNHFADRQALLTALVDAHRERMSAQLAQSLADTAGKPLRARLESLLATLFTAVASKARHQLMLMEGAATHFARRKQMRERFTAMLVPVFAQAREKGELVKDDAGLQPALLFGLVRGIFELGREGGLTQSPDEAAKVVVSAFLDGAAPREVTK